MLARAWSYSCFLDVSEGIAAWWCHAWVCFSAFITICVYERGLTVLWFEYVKQTTATFLSLKGVTSAVLFILCSGPHAALLPMRRSVMQSAIRQKMCLFGCLQFIGGLYRVCITVLSSRQCDIVLAFSLFWSHRVQDMQITTLKGP